jgi:hypothetical protein
MKIRFTCSWCNDHLLKIGAISDYSEDGNGTWGDMVAVEDDTYDYAVVFNNTCSNIDFKRSILFLAEPSYISNTYKQTEYMFRYDLQNHHSVCCTFVKTPHRDLLKSSPIKTKEFSAVISHLYSQHNHVSRRNFLLNHLYKNFPSMDHYGKGFDFTGDTCCKGIIENKEDALLPYKYSFAAESVIEKGYFTEKIIDCILTETLCFYSGCPNIDKFIPYDCYIPINLDNPQESIDIIRSSIANNEYEKRLDKIRECKKYIIKELNPFNLVRKIINKEIT